MAPSNSRERQLEFAKIWHRVFSSNLLYVVQSIQDDSSIDPDRVGDHTACMLGKWILAQPPEIQAMDAYRQLVEVHRLYHGVARQTTNAYLYGEEALVEELVQGDFKRYSEGVIEAISALAVALSEAGIFAPRFAAPHPESRPGLWNESLEIGIPAIDQRHQAIASLIDELGASQDLVCSPGEDIHFLEALTSLIRNDIELEQNHLRDSRADLALYAEHFADHDRILNYINALSEQIHQGKNLPLADIGQHLSQWFVAHLVNHDLALGRP